jgi:hypothetical protein
MAVWHLPKSSVNRLSAVTLRPVVCSLTSGHPACLGERTRNYHPSKPLWLPWRLYSRIWLKVHAVEPRTLIIRYNRHGPIRPHRKDHQGCALRARWETTIRAP